MTIPDRADAVVIGSGPNGLVAAIALARKGWDVVVLEGTPVAGGAIRTEELTVPGYRHDTYSGFYGLLHSSPVFSELGLDAIDWAHFDTPMGAAVAPERAAVVHRDLDATASGLGEDADAYRDLVAWWDRLGSRFFDMTLAPVGTLRPALRVGRRAGVRGALPFAHMMLTPVEHDLRARFSTDEARSLIACGITHSDVSVSDIGGMPLAVVLAMIAQRLGMPVPVGGAGAIVDELLRQLAEYGGSIHTGRRAARVVVAKGRAVAVETADGGIVAARHAVMAATGATALFRDLVGEDHLPSRFLDGLRAYRQGSGVFKVDLALRGPAPWMAEAFRSTGVVHLCGTLDDMARATFEVSRGTLPAEPSLIVGQQTIADPSRAPAGCHTLWIEMHVPPRPAEGPWETVRDPFLERVLARLERFAPGVRDLIVGTSVKTPVDLERENPNLVGGDLGGGTASLDQQLVFRPVPGWFRYRTPVKGLYLCSASAHPGGGVHGMGGWNAAKRALRDSWRPRGIVKTASGARRAPTPPA